MARWPWRERSSRSAQVGVSAPGLAAPPTTAEAAGEKVIPLERYTTPKGQALARTHQQRVQKYAEQIWGCLPWLDLQKQSIGFQRPKGAPGDDRYFSTWILIPQAENPKFAALSQSRRMSAMFSRYGVDLLRRMAGVHDVLADSNVHGFSVVLSWLKPGTSRPGAPARERELGRLHRQDHRPRLPRAADPPRRVRPADPGAGIRRADDLGPQELEIWDDTSPRTFKLPNYDPPAGITC